MDTGTSTSSMAVGGTNLLPRRCQHWFQHSILANLKEPQTGSRVLNKRFKEKMLQGQVRCHRRSTMHHCPDKVFVGVVGVGLSPRGRTFFDEATTHEPVWQPFAVERSHAQTRRADGAGDTHTSDYYE